MWASNERVLSKMTPKFLTWREGETEEPSMDREKLQDLERLELVVIRSTSVLLPLRLRKWAENQLFILWRQLVRQTNKQTNKQVALATSTSATSTEKPLIQPRIGTRCRIPHMSNILGSPGKHSHHVWVWLGQRYHTRRGQCSRVVIPRERERERALRCSDRHPVVWGRTEGNGWCTPFCRGPSPIPAGCGVLEGWGTPLGQALTVILKSPLLFFLLHRTQRCPGCRVER